MKGFFFAPKLDVILGRASVGLPQITSHHYTSDTNEVNILTTERGYVSDNDGEAIFYLK